MVDILDFLIRLGIRHSWDIPDKKTNRETPIKILRKRLPGGEITKEEFVDKKKRIEIN